MPAGAHRRSGDAANVHLRDSSSAKSAGRKLAKIDIEALDFRAHGLVVGGRSVVAIERLSLSTRASACASTCSPAERVTAIVKLATISAASAHASTANLVPTFARREAEGWHGVAGGVRGLKPGCRSAVTGLRHWRSFL